MWNRNPKDGTWKIERDGNDHFHVSLYGCWTIGGSYWKFRQEFESEKDARDFVDKQIRAAQLTIIAEITP